MQTNSTDNAFAAAVRMVEGKWKIDILCELGTAPRRFGRLKQALSGVSEKMLVQQLRELEADGLVARKAYAETPAKVVYSLTERGLTLNVNRRPKITPYRHANLALTQIWCITLMSHRSAGLEEDRAFRVRTFGVLPA